MCYFRPYFQLRDAFAAVYFVNGLFQLSLSVARVRPDPLAAEPLKFAHFLTSRKRSGRWRWALKSKSILICLSPERWFFFIFLFVCALAMHKIIYTKLPLISFGFISMRYIEWAHWGEGEFLYGSIILLIFLNTFFFLDDVIYQILMNMSNN